MNTIADAVPDAIPDAIPDARDTTHTQNRPQSGPIRPQSGHPFLLVTGGVAPYPPTLFK
jgi:hypothetical protein